MLFNHLEASMTALTAKDVNWLKCTKTTIAMY